MKGRLLNQHVCVCVCVCVCVVIVFVVIARTLVTELLLLT